ncbi:MAG: hypothetical protein EZS28_053046, partial [Streblomastix strix]
METRMDIDRNQNGYETRGEPRGGGQGAFRRKESNYQRRVQSCQDGEKPYQERYRNAQRYNPYTIYNFSKTRNLLNWNRTHQYDNRNRGEGCADDPNDEWTKHTQMGKDPPENHFDRDSTWSEVEATQYPSAVPQPNQPVHPTQRIQQVQIYPKHQTSENIYKLLVPSRYKDLYETNPESGLLSEGNRCEQNFGLSQFIPVLIMFGADEAIFYSAL